MASYCSKCGSKVFNESIFCDYCGNKLKNRNSTRRYDEPILDDSPKRFSNKPIPNNSSRGSSPYSYYSYNKTPSSGIKWIVIGVFIIGIIGLAVLALTFIAIIPIEEYRGYQLPLFEENDNGVSEYSLSLVQPGQYYFTAIMQNDGIENALTNSGSIPISWEDMIYELPLYNGVGLLDESFIGFDLNGNGNSMILECGVQIWLKKLLNL